MKLMGVNVPTMDQEISKLRFALLCQLRARRVSQQMGENLIKAVRKRSPLWDPSVEFYDNNNIINVLWKEVAEELGSSEYKVQASWNTLIEIYRHELKNVQNSSENEPKNSNWVHFNSMLFLQEMINSKNSDTNDSQSESVDHTAPTTENDVICVHNEENGTINWVNQDVKPKTSVVVKETHNRKMKNCSDLYMNVLMHMENKKLEDLEKKAQTEDDDDLLFLKSLLPQIKMLSLSKKMGVRLKFQEIICKEIEDFEKRNGRME